MEQNGVLLIVCGPSGVGKTSLCHELVDRYDELRFSVSYTTRDRRSSEVDGEDYHFVEPETFEEMREEGRFAEWAEVHGHRYGTSFGVLREAWEDDFDLVFDIDYQGARQLKEHFPNSTGVLVIPPDMETLAERLEGRGSESEEAYERRLDNAKMELSQYHLFDFVVENDDFEDAVERLGAVLVASRHWRNLQKSKVERLLQEG